eukprot:gnl/TRDRNA2_/TRDRNA2_81534_c0_seq1.p1 gnl/TRDRNA2_/TRDRNA2_81534_c0~~gnl/TRDRNA2_/TRDRNA2_81534_c0_seq1.p1  ORF type:complete len:413 (-),score=65.66 gnl/TRDRNA2_/TRDRNA2_81534_c0_seq1:55-1293(-)
MNGGLLTDHLLRSREVHWETVTLRGSIPAWEDCQRACTHSVSFCILGLLWATAALLSLVATRERTSALPRIAKEIPCAPVQPLNLLSSTVSGVNTNRSQEERIEEHQKEDEEESGSEDSVPMDSEFEKMVAEASDPIDGSYWLEVFRIGTNMSAALENKPDREADVIVTKLPNRYELWRRLIIGALDSDATLRVDFSELRPEEAEWGYELWPAAVAAAAWVMFTPGGLPLGGDVLELGSGTGVFGIVAGIQLAATSRMHEDVDLNYSITLSELTDVLVDNLNDTLKENTLLLDGLEAAKTCKLDWKNATSPSYIPRATYDHILAADCVYELAHAVTLVAAIVTHLKDDGSAYLVVQPDRDGVKETREALSRHGTVARMKAVLWKRPSWSEEDHRSAELLELWIFRKAKHSAG